LLTQTIKREDSPEFISIYADTLWVISTAFPVEPENNKWVNIAKLSRYTLHGKLLDETIISRIRLETPSGTIPSSPYYISGLGSEKYIYYPVLTPDQVLRDTVYIWQNQKISPVIKLDFGKASFYANLKRQIYIENIFLSKRYLFSEYSFNSGFRTLCYDRVINKCLCNFLIKDDIFGAGKIRLRPVDLNRGLMYFTKEAFKPDSIVDEISDSSNPIVFFVRLKN
jgi:hypothetical protein